MIGRPLKILNSPVRLCNTCNLELPLWTEFYKSGISKRTKEQWYGRICKSCDYQINEINRIRHPEINRKAVKKYQAKRRRSKHAMCFTCPVQLSSNNPSGYCLQCYILMWIRCQWRNFEKHNIGDESAGSRRNELRHRTADLIRLLGNRTFPEWRLKHKLSVKYYPGLAFTLNNINWVPVNEKLSRAHLKRELLNV